MNEDKLPERDAKVTVAVVGICSPDHLARCLDGLQAQVDAPDFDVVVAHDPELRGVEALAARYPGVRLVANAGQRTPLELASRAIDHSTGDIVLLTEDHCVPQRNWVRTMVAAHAPGRAVIGGRVEIRDGASAVDWAFYFVDFFRYADPVLDGPSPTLTVCNASYKKAQLEAVRHTWKTYFHETAINNALRERFGDLWLTPQSEVIMGRHVTFADAIYERYAFGRLFGCTRIGFVSPAHRLTYVIFAPLLPLVLLTRMAKKAFPSSKLLLAFLRGLGPLVVMVLWWSWGEWLGYVTGKHPRTLTVAPEIRAAQREGARPTA